MPNNASTITIVLATGNPHKVDELRAILADRGHNPVGNDGAGAQQLPRSTQAQAAHAAGAALAPGDTSASLQVPHGTPAVTDRALLCVLGLQDLPGHERFVEPEETGTTFAANARIKAISYAQQTGMLCLADDSGIEIDALALADGIQRPGVISSHYSTDGRETGLSRAERDAANNARVFRELEGVGPEDRGARFVCCMCLAGPTGEILHETRGEFPGRIGVPPRVPKGEHGFGYDPIFLVGPEFLVTGAEMESAEKNRMSHRGKATREMTEWIKVTGHF